MKYVTWISALALLGTTGCRFYTDAPDYSLVANPGDAPCDALPGTSSPVYLCDEVTQGLLFVSEQGDDAQPGTREQPVRTLSQALLLASDQPDKTAILVGGAPMFEGPIELEQSVDLLGGFDENFEPDANARPVLRASSSPVLRVQSLERSARVAGFDFALQEGPGPVYGVSVYNTTLLVLRDVHMTLPNGASGLDGQDGQMGADGERGSAAGAGTAVNPGGGGQNPSCVDAAAGAGGRGGDMSMAAEPGVASALGASGGMPGADGMNGEVGMDGEAGMDSGPWMWREGRFEEGSAATPGEPGASGQGGGGGGGGLAQGSQGGGGGGGGAGGCGGTGGTAGTSGQPVVGIFVEQSAVLLEGSTSVLLGNGGDAGQGGAGQQGGEGASGLPGAAGAGGQVGGRGGRGASGGRGGDGGSGQAGASIGVFCVQGSVQVDDTVSIVPGEAGKKPDDTLATQAETLGCDG